VHTTILLIKYSIKTTTIRTSILSAILFVLSTANVWAESNNFKMFEPLDPTIINGKQYTFFVYNVEGHQYLNGQGFERGTMCIKGKTYHNQLLRYDIYNQVLLLKFRDQFDAEKIIIVSDAWLTSFTIGSMKFELVENADGKRKITQKIDGEGISIVFEWEKTLTLNASNGMYKFSEPIKGSYLIINGEKIKFNGNRSFARAFGKENEKIVRKYLRQNRIKVKKVNDISLEKVIKHCKSFI